MIDTDKLETAILKRLQMMNGEQKGHNSTGWMSLLSKELGYVEPAEVISAMKRLCADGIVHLQKYDEALGGLYEYRMGDSREIETQFFGYGSFDVSISDYGRRFLSVPRRPIGFQPV